MQVPPVDAALDALALHICRLQLDVLERDEHRESLLLFCQLPVELPELLLGAFLDLDDVLLEVLGEAHLRVDDLVVHVRVDSACLLIVSSHPFSLPL